MKAPEFWHNDGIIPYLFSPLGKAYEKAFNLYSKSINAWRSPIPVICVGNIVVGGTGKTPIALDIGRSLITDGYGVHFLTRGYRGNLKGPVLVDCKKHSAKEVGDEPLILTLAAPTWVSRNRVKGVKSAARAGADLVIMDDGLQNPYLEKKISLLVIDEEYGVGNGRVLPAGPMRESLASAFQKTDAIILVGNKKKYLNWLDKSKPVFRVEIVPGPEIENLRESQVVAFSGIGRPDKFFDLLRASNINVVASFEFPDHHFYLESEIKNLRRKAAELRATLVSTEKDLVRLSDEDQDGIKMLRISILWENEKKFKDFLLGHLK